MKRREHLSDPELSDAEREEIERVLPEIRARGYAFGTHLMTRYA
jgi:hypothetical protein